MKPLISIVIPTYNRANDLRRALKSVCSQTYTNWEVIVIDNHSSDNTESVVKNFGDSRLRLFKIDNQGVIARSRNMGISEAQGEYIALLDSDDWWTPQKLAISIDHLERGYDVSYHDLWGVKREVGQVFKRRLKGRHVSQPVYADLIKNGNAIKTSSVVVRKELLRKIGGQSEDPGLVAAEDFECWLRISKETEKFIYVPSVLGYYWMGGENTSNPMRSINYLNRLRALHIEPYIKQKGDDSPIWWEYGYARATYLTGETDAARKLLQQLVGRRPMSWPISLKVRFMLARIG
jgi:glycosyltransferase involved in cell wall biosynthesis